MKKSKGEDDPVQQELHLINAQAEDFKGGGGWGGRAEMGNDIDPSCIPAPLAPPMDVRTLGAAGHAWGPLCHT